ncbi:MAG: hypothetical protein OXN83_00915 [Oligoflexia bacterium]|nr:hypothetical protein [Oligoflexia bacterium]
MKKTLFFCLACFSLSSCLVGSGSNDVRVKVVSYHSNSDVQTASGAPYIRTKGTRQICRWRPFRQRTARDQLLQEGVDKEVLDDYLFPIEEEEGEESESYEVIQDDPVYLQLEDYWLRFGLQITNITDFVLIIDTIRYQARARCGSQIFSHSGEFSFGYCSGGGGDEAPYLYVVPPVETTGKQINYKPLSSNPFDNLTLYIDGLPVLDRTGEASPSFQSRFEDTGVAGTFGSAEVTDERECQPNEPLVVPQYTIELTLVGYFMLPRGSGEQTGGFQKRISFPTTFHNSF